MPSPAELEDYLANGEYSDLKIICNGATYMVHRLILCSQIRFFENACNISWKEGEEGVVDLSHDDPGAVKAMIHYAYTGNCAAFDNAEDSQQAQHWIQVYAIGSKYDFLGLKTKAKVYVEPILENNWDKDWFADMIRLVYGTTISDRGLRDIVVTIVLEHHSTFAEQSGDAPMQKLLEEVGEFSRDCFNSL
ncbi:hypothetical protein BU16DRAFT_590340 [Lophium mytilinum]|uniref:BTB domain-containing protein n=1 Tax=Lophium mytilinum TaxID=390894 RepID=A0A6A6QN75_9PEZI|nr:hypothetical protein BU16DRAFT_590340 [Lophium mytilinum]